MLCLRSDSSETDPKIKNFVKVIKYKIFSGKTGRGQGKWDLKEKEAKQEYDAKPNPTENNTALTLQGALGIAHVPLPSCPYHKAKGWGVCNNIHICQSLVETKYGNSGGVL
jgi:hypothetical protein